MSGLVAESWNAFGGDLDYALDGLWAARGSDFGVGAAATTLEVPAFTTDGRYWLKVGDRGAGMRRVLPTGAQSAVGFCAINYFPELPSVNDRAWLVEFRNGSNARVAKIAVTTDGNLDVYNSAGAIVASTVAPCITAGAAQKLQAQITLHATLGEVVIKINDVEVLSASGLVLAGSATQFFFGDSDTSFGPQPTWYQQFCVTYSLTGTYNDDFPQITGVTEVYPAADTIDAGMTPRPRQTISDGVLYVQGSGDVLDCGALAAYDLGDGDFTLETFVRFSELPSGSNFATIIGKWSASTSRRSYRLVKYGPSANDGALRFEITTDGTLATLVAVADIAWSPEIGTIYNIAVSRTAGVTRVFIDGFQVGLPIADANLYYPSTTLAKLTVGGEMSGVGTTVLANSSFNGMIDATRVTVGVGRYTANYAPTTVPYPTTVGGDPDFADVQLLAEYDESIADLSSYAHTLTPRGNTAFIIPNDGAAAYETINPPGPIDDRFLEAALLSSQGILTLTANPLNTETVTLGATTYTFKNAISVANDVLIGTDGEATLSNLAAAINQGPGSGTLYGAGTVQNASAFAELGPTNAQLTAIAITPGAAGNSIASTSTVTGGAWSAATLLGGADIPGPSRFTLTPLDPRVTGVRWLEMRNRSFLSAGAGKLQASFVVDGSAAAGADNSLTTNPSYRFDVIEEDPDTTGALTPTSIINGSIELERTA